MNASSKANFLFPSLIAAVLAMGVPACGGSDDDDPEIPGPEADASAADGGSPAGDAGISGGSDASTSPTPADAGAPADGGVPCQGCVPQLDFVSIPGGTFTIGHATATYASGAAVQVDAFAMGKTPTTCAQFSKCIDAGACSASGFDSYSTLCAGKDKCNLGRGDAWADHPMNCVHHEGARQFCQWIGGRLPTEEEWEYAATHDGTAPKQTAYPWGDSKPKHCVTANFNSGPNLSKPYCNGKEETASKTGTSPVGIYSGDTPLGLVDMGGNVLEWTDSPIEENSTDFTTKGGSWGSNDFALKSDFRYGRAPDKGDPHYGFRCVMDAPRDRD